jgi:hypothetical protein
VDPWGLRRRATASFVAGVLLIGAAGAAAQVEPSGLGPPRRDEVLPGLGPLHPLVDVSEPWFDRATAGLARALPSFAVVQHAESLDWPPASGFLIGANHVVTAHLRELAPGEQPPRFLIRFTDGQTRESVQVAGWAAHDFGVLRLDRPVDLPPIEIGDERSLTRGEPLLNIGNPAIAGRSGLALTSVWTFLDVRGDAVRFDGSTASGGSGGPVMDLDGRLVGISSFGIDFFSVRLEDMTVSELQLRNAFPIARGGGDAGVAASVLGRLTAEYQR